MPEETPAPQPREPALADEARPGLDLRLIALLNVTIFALVTFVAVLVALPAQLLALPFDPQRRVSNAVAAVCWGRVLVAAEPLWHLTRTGTERLAGVPPCILIANHQSMLDIPLLMGLGRPVRVIARPAVFTIPGIGWMARLSGQVALEATDGASAQQALTRCAELLAAGISVVVFPEGTRGDGDSLQAFHRGAFELALRTGAPVVPVVIAGTADALPRGSVRPRVPRCRFHLQVLPPVPDGAAGPAGTPLPAARRQLAAYTQARMATALAAPRPWALADAVARRYAGQGRWRMGWAWGKTTYDPVYYALHERLPAQGRLLDLGAGEGLLAGYLVASGHHLRYEGYDIDGERIDVAKRANPGVPFSVVDIRTVDLGVADAIVCIDVLHYLSPADQAGLLSRMCAALRPDGILIVRDPEVRGSHRARTAFTVGSEQLLVATGRHATAPGGSATAPGGSASNRGERSARVSPQGSVWIGARLKDYLDDVRVEAGSPGTPFHNALLSGRRVAAATIAGSPRA